ncbi:hypothetical protein [Clostridium felsineum]|uniref:Uncharacterized protein n=1 Tax=Clostridium felsineum TaxID=36839 RepID=A0A1S8M9W5_9CLOT|nr:hypothetical protein [Clostridium felsineum]URZ06830.1 hypothetical protein CLROS_021630 [Clostridium felsineum]URZ11862.1 hypothetical protein CROST_025790 [Clostridium felsineum]URZ16387.1 hypothetical protein CLFE_024340 [Clostridium felsineum DSM 794]
MKNRIIICVILIVTCISLAIINLKADRKNVNINKVKVTKTKVSKLNYEEILDILNKYDDVTVEDIKRDDRNGSSIYATISFNFNKNKFVKVIENLKKEKSIGGIDNIVVNNKDNNKDCKIQLKFNR